MLRSSQAYLISEDIQAIVEIIPERLLWGSGVNMPPDYKRIHIFCTDSTLKYEPFYSDFGPLNIGMIYKYIEQLNKILAASKYSKSMIGHFTNSAKKYRSNSVLLIGAFQILVLGKSAAEAWKPFSATKLEQYIDVSVFPSDFQISIYHCLLALETATKFGWYSQKSFNHKDFSKYDSEDINWLIPGKILASSTPCDNPKNLPDVQGVSIKNFLPKLLKLKVKKVIQLNESLYDSKKLELAGITHVDLEFQDGSCPGESSVKLFLEEIKSAKAATIVHGKAGLGRTGTMIGLYLMQNYKIPAVIAIAWMRIGRPGMVIGPQQEYLGKMQKSMFESTSDVYNDLAEEIKRFLENLSFEVDSMSKKNIGGGFGLKKLSPFGVNDQANQGIRLLKLKLLNGGFKENLYGNQNQY